jgi:hypothetical protein
MYEIAVDYRKKDVRATRTAKFCLGVGTKNVVPIISYL